MKYKLSSMAVSFLSDPVRVRLLVSAILLTLMVASFVATGTVASADGVPGGGSTYP